MLYQEQKEFSTGWLDPKYFRPLIWKVSIIRWRSKNSINLELLSPLESLDFTSTVEWGLDWPISLQGTSAWWKIGAGRSSEVERSLMVRWVVGSILHGVDPLSYFSFQPVLHDGCHKSRGMCYPVCGIVHIKEPLLLIDKSSLCGGSGFPFSLSEWSLTICLTPYNRR